MEKLFQIYIKSHCEVPDYEDMVEAKDKAEALTKFKTQTWQLGDFDDNFLLTQIDELEGSAYLIALEDSEGFYRYQCAKCEQRIDDEWVRKFLLHSGCVIAIGHNCPHCNARWEYEERR